MSFLKIVMLLIVILAGWTLGRVSLRLLGNKLLGGTMFGGDFL